MGLRASISICVVAALVAGCGGSTHFLRSGTDTGAVSTGPVSETGGGSGSGSGSGSGGGGGVGKLDFPMTATKNTTRVGGNAIQNAAAVALAVYPSAIPGTHPSVVTLAPSSDWQAAIASASLMGTRLRAPLLFSGAGSMPGATRSALRALAPTGVGSLGGAKVIKVGDVAGPHSLKTTQISGSDPYTLAASIDSFEARASGRESTDVVIASGTAPAYAMPAAGWAAESGDPILYVKPGSIPAVTATALRAHHHPHIYVLGPSSAVSGSTLTRLKRYGVVKRISGSDPADSSVAFASYRDPACPSGQPCGHVPHSFGWAIRSPGHAYVLINTADPLDAAAAAPLSGSGGYGPQLVVQNPNTLPKSVLNYFLNYATPGYATEGPTSAVYNHGWLIGGVGSISLAVQAQVDSLLEAVPQRSAGGGA